MKKTILTLAVVAFVASLTSCKKDYTCTCDLGILGSVSTDYNDLNKADAKAAGDACESTSLCTWSEK